MSSVSSMNTAHMDIEQIDSLVAAAGADGAREILDAFWHSTSTLLAALEKQLGDKAFDIAAQTAHAVKGSAANVGACRLAQTAAQIEIACKNGDQQSAGDALPNAAQDFASFKECFNAHLSGA